MSKTFQEKINKEKHIYRHILATVLNYRTTKLYMHQGRKNKLSKTS